MLRRVLVLALSVGLVAPVAAVAAPGGLPLPVVDPTVAAARDTEAVVLNGTALGDWAAPGNATAKTPSADLACQLADNGGPNPLATDCGDGHNSYADPDVDTGEVVPGTPTASLSGWRWNGTRFVEVPFQVDEVFTRYLDNRASGFSVYSGQDQHTSYAFDREGFRWTEQTPGNPCLARPASPVATDPVTGLDTDDELAFMAADAGAKAPADARTPAGVDGVKVVTVTDPLTQASSYLYVMRGRTPSYDGSNGYVRYQRDANADTFEKSESSYDNYGNAARGIVCDDAGNVVATNERRRPRDRATVTTDRYTYRYDGRWLMTGIRISPDGGKTYDRDLVDRWKARAFQQDAESETPCCGYEEEDTNWGGSSTLLGERTGPVRVIRETWGADSATNAVRRETFYRAEMTMKTFLRVHVIPPLDGIYAQWDYNAGVMDRFRNSRKREGVAVDGVNDEAFGNLDDPCNSKYDANSTGQLSQAYRQAYRTTGACATSPYSQSIDLADPTFGDPNVIMQWGQTSGRYGTIVDRFSAQARDMTPGGAVQGLVAQPYYRDDSCFDDATGTNPGPRLKLRSAGEPTTFNGAPRRCWQPSDGIVDGDARFFQGDIGTHGVHLLFLADSDNARTTVPITEIVTEQRQVFLPGDPGDVGEQYGRGFEKPLVAAVTNGSATPGDPQAEPTVLDLADAVASKKGDVALVATLTSQGRPVSGRTVVLTFAGRTATTVTDSSGTARATIAARRKDAPGTATARFAGDRQYLASEDQAAVRSAR